MSVLGDFFTKEESDQLKKYQQKISEAKTPFGVMVYNLKARALLNKVRKEQEVGLRIITSIRNKDVETTNMVQVRVGDTIKFASGNVYKVKKISIMGSVSICSYYLDRQYTFTTNKEKITYCSSLRELNYLLQEESHLIVEIIPREFSKKEKELTIEECHELALDWESRMENLKELGIVVSKRRK